MSHFYSLARRLKLVDHLGMTGFGVLALMFGAVVALTVAIVTVTVTIESRNCAYASQNYHRATHYDWLAGCYVSIGHGQRVELGKYRAFQSVPSR